MFRNSITVFFALLCISSNVWASADSDMRELASKADNWIREGDYGQLKVKLMRGRPLFSPKFKEYMSKREAELKAEFISFVDEQPSEFGRHAAKAKRNPKGYLSVRFLFEIENVYKVFNADQQHIGWAIDFTNHVDAAKIQDGSWELIYLDKGFNIIVIKAGQA